MSTHCGAIGLAVTPRVLHQWTWCNGVVLDFMRPGRPRDKAVMEAFSARFRQQCLNERWFVSVADAHQRVEVWREHYNRERSHSSLGNIAPEDFLNQTRVPSPRG